MRTVPPLAHQGALTEFAGLIRDSITHISGADICDRGWSQASLPIRAGGLGLRNVSDHSFAAYVASFKGAAELGVGNFDPDDSENFSGVQDAARGLAAKVQRDAAMDLGAIGIKQKKLSGLIDAKSSADLVSSQRGDRPYLQHLALQTIYGAGVWLTALPSNEDLRMDPSSFRITLARRLRLKVQPEDGPCSRCGGLMDCFGDHALVCPCAGDRTKRHNCLRNRVHDSAREGGLAPEREKAGLLPASMDHGGADGIGGVPVPQSGDPWEPPDPGPDLLGRGRRRPADVFIPRGPLGNCLLYTSPSPRD